MPTHVMRQNLAKAYSPAWVARQSDQQILAIHLRLQRKGVIKV